MGRLFADVYAPSTLRSFTRGHTRQLTSVARRLLLRLAARTSILDGAEKLAYVDIDSMLRRIYGHQKHGARFGRTKVGAYPVMLRGLSPLETTLSTPISAPVVAAMRLRAGTPVRPGARPASPPRHWPPRKPQASHGSWFPVWRYHAFRNDTTFSTVDDGLAHRQHAVIETVFADLIVGPLAHLPSERFNANAVWAICAAICHNLLRAAGSLASRFHARARGTTLRRHLIAVPAHLAEPQHKPVLHLPIDWSWQDAWISLDTAATACLSHTAWPRPHA